MTTFYKLLKSINRQLASIKLTIFLLMFLSIVCVLGTIVPQNASIEKYLSIYNTSTYSLLDRTGITDLFHSWWFRAILSLFIANLVACTLSRIKNINKLFLKSEPLLEQNRAKQLFCFREFTMEEVDKKKITGLLSGLISKPLVTEKKGTVNFFSEKGRISHSAFYLIHLGLIIISAGVLWGTTGFNGFMRLYEGETSGKIILRKTNEPLELDFKVRCDNFDVRFYEKYNMPKSFESTLTITENGKDILSKVIRVNDPLDYKGIRFYQSNYGTARTRGDILLKITPTDSDNSTTLRIPLDSSINIPETDDSVYVSNLIPDFGLDSNGDVFTRSEEFNNPAVRVTVKSNEEPLFSSWIFARFPGMHKHPDQPYEFHFLNFFPIYYTGLQVATSPGIWFIWTGCIILVLGTIISFFTSHQRLWLCATENKGSFKATLAGTANRNKQAFETEFNKLYNYLTNS